MRAAREILTRLPEIAQPVAAASLRRAATACYSTREQEQKGDMTSARLTSVVVGSALLTTWLVSAGVTRQAEEHVGPPAPPQAVDPIASAAADLATQTARLHARLGDFPAPKMSARNPFRFDHSEHPIPQARRATERGAGGTQLGLNAGRDVAAAMVEPAAPLLRLIGIAIDQRQDGPVRSAALSVAGDVVLVRPGDEVAGRYRVTAISPDVVELTDLLGGPPLRLPIR